MKKKKPTLLLHKILENRQIACEYDSYYGYEKSNKVRKDKSNLNKKSRDLLVSILKANHPDYQNMTLTEIGVRISEEVQ